ncbi:IS21 family transposase [candidate division KSB1 bacterium]|nr:IS21 family transposase [candidate division KSB1 bacterium]NIX71727.1 IS21 family transposase [candidate division KSB1 bacterium]
MEKVREIIRLKEHCGLSERAISRALRVSRPVVKDYLCKLQSAGLDYAAIKEMNDDTLSQVIEGRRQDTSERYQTLRRQFGYFAKELKRPGVTRERLWQEYRAEHPDGYGYSQFCYHFQLWRSTSELTMHMNHKAGDKMFVDFTGKKLRIVDKSSGEIKEVETFVAILGASQYTYVEAVASQKKADLINATQNAFHYFGGVPRAVVPDCLKTAVNNSNNYEPDINPEYADLARHYQTVILPARPNRPKDKALVEGAVRIVYAWIYAALRDRIFTSLQELNRAIAEELEKYNAKPMQRLTISRKTLFEQTDKGMLTPLPPQQYVIREFKSLKVQFNYHIYLSNDKHYYSVPYRYRGNQVRVIYTDSVVEIFYKNQRIAFHKRNRTPNGYTTVKDHMPSHHKAMSDWNPQRLINWASHLGEYVEAVIAHILKHRQHPEQAYKVCLGILNLAKRFGKTRLNKACRRAIDFQHYSYKGIKNILENRTEEQQLDCFETLPEHQNIRGSHYYN